MKRPSPALVRKVYLWMLILALGSGLAFLSTPETQAGLRTVLAVGCFGLFAAATAVKLALFRCSNCRRMLPNEAAGNMAYRPYCGAPLTGGPQDKA